MKNMDTNELNDWQTKLQKFLYGKLVGYFPDSDDVVGRFVDQDAMANVWTHVFTQETLSPNSGYSKYEYYGKQVLLGLFNKYLFARYPECDSVKYANMTAAYMSREYKITLGEKLGIKDHIIHIGLKQTPPNIISDTFNAFFGGLVTVGDSIASGLGYEIAFNLIFDMFASVVVTHGAATSQPSVQIDKIFAEFTGKEGNVIPRTTITDDGKYHVKIELSKDQFATIGLPTDTNPVIGEHTANTKRGAIQTAYKHALKFLHSKGIDEQWAHAQKSAIDLYSVKTYKADAFAARDKFRKTSKNKDAEIEFGVSTEQISQGIETIVLYGVQATDTNSLCEPHHKTLLYYETIDGLVNEKIGVDAKQIAKAREINKGKRLTAKTSILKKYNALKADKIKLEFNRI